MSTNDDKILEQVRHLVAKIEHPNTSEEEREMCRARADTLMFRYAIDDAMLRQAEKAGVRTKPVTSTFVVSSTWNKYREELITIIKTLAATNRCRVVTMRDGDDYSAKLVGFEADVRFVEMMFTSIHLVFAAKIDPKWDPSRTEGENVRTLKEAGWKWEAIARAGEFDWPDSGLLIRTYKRQCKIDGVQAMATQRHSAYRISFADSFFTNLANRMRTFAHSRDEQVRSYENETGATGTALVLADRGTEVDEAFYTLFPDQRPLTDEQRTEIQKSAHDQVERRNARDMAEREAMLAAMSPAKRAAFLRREAAEQEREAAREEREYIRWERAYNRQQGKRWDAAGSRAGRDAAAAIDLSGGRGNVGGADRKSLDN